MTDFGLPDPARHAGFYADVTTKRFMAWLVDVVLVTVLSLILMPLTLFTAIFFFPLFMLTIGLAYRTVTLARGSATWGMRLAAIELRGPDGERVDAMTAFLHSAGYIASVAVFPVQIVSVVLMMATPRKQGLSDHLLGTAMINRVAPD